MRKGPHKRTSIAKQQERCEWVIDNLRHKIDAYIKKLPPFGSDLGIVNGVTAADVVVGTRFVKKLASIDDSSALTRRNRSIDDMVKRDALNEHYVLPNTDDIQWARLRLHHWFRGFRKTYRFRPPNGASAQATAGYNDILSKMQDVTQWEVSPENITYATQIAYSNHALKRLVRVKFREQFPYLEVSAYMRTKLGQDVTGFRMFREMFKSLVTINSVSRVETVPKNNDEDRVITCEPLWDMICQLSYMCDIRSHMRNALGYDINTRGDLHKTLVNGKVATIDLKAASDSVTTQLVFGLWPANMVADLKMLRPKLIEDREHGIVPLHMFAPMGTGVTFDVMSFTILALLRFDRSATVFGDDIIVKRDSVPRVLTVLRDAGLVVNKDKSFTDGKFRESCGAMYHDDIGYVTSFEFQRPVDVCDRIAFINKLQLILQAKQISFELEGLLLEGLLRMLETVPRDAFADKPLELSSEYVTGLGGSRVLTKLSSAFDQVLHRRCTFHSAYVKRAVEAPIWCPATMLFGFLHRGSSPAVCKRTEVTRITLETERGIAIRAIPLTPLSLI